MKCYQRVLMPILACLSSMSGIAACVAQSAAPPAGKADQKKLAAEQTAPYSVRVSTDKKVYAVGDPITLKLTIRNTTKEDLYLGFTSGQRFDFEIRRGAKPDGPLVWQFSKGMMFTMMMTREKLQPGKTRSYAFLFEPKSNKSINAEPLTAGVYTVNGNLAVGEPLARPQGTVTFRVK